VIYHRRDPIEHLNQLSKCLKSGGELIIESLVIDSDNLDVLIPKERYAKMKNVWSIPSLKLLTKWIKNAGFKNTRTIDITKTTIQEQRLTEWMEFESLTDFLNKWDKNKTIEGYPAPIRSVLISEKP
jgi:tRNA (mo5U34)-methyltransferase